MNRSVTSREYKLILNPARFDRPRRATRVLWRLVRYLARQAGGQLLEEQQSVHERLTWYCDTPGSDLRRNGYILRMRREKDDKHRTVHKVTLKFRHADRYFSAAQELHAPKHAEYKFEEDIGPPFASMFSHSAAVFQPRRPKFKTLREAAEIFRGLEALDVDLDAPLRCVNDFRAYERCLWLGQFAFGDVPVKTCVTFWFAAKHRNAGPLVIELSYDYDLKDGAGRGNPARDSGKHELEDFDPALTAGAGRLFGLLQNQRAWIDPAGTTKTAFANGGMGA